MIVLYMLLWAWELPQILVGLVLMALYHPRATILQAGVLVCYVDTIRIGFPDTLGQTLGRVMFIKLEPRADWHEIMNHERRHVAQSDVLGPLWGPLYGLAGVYAWATGKGFYTGNWFELDARKAAGEA